MIIFSFEYIYYKKMSLIPAKREKEDAKIVYLVMGMSFKVNGHWGYSHIKNYDENELGLVMSKINLKEIANSGKTYKNEDALKFVEKHNFFSKFHPFHDIYDIHAIMIEFEKIDRVKLTNTYEIYIVFTEIFNIEKLTYKDINKDENDTLFASFQRHNAYMYGFFLRRTPVTPCGNAYFKWYLNEFKKNIEKPKLSNLNSFGYDEKFKTKFFNHQINNINKMIEREQNGVEEVYISENIIVIEEIQRFFNFRNFMKEEVLFEKIEDLEKVKIHGGIMVDDTGIGKTLSMLGLCMLNPINTIGIVPDYLLIFWNEQIKKHISGNTDHIKIISFSKFKSDYETKYKKQLNEENSVIKRFFVDNIHELFLKESNEELWNIVKSINAKCKWCLTEILFPIEHSLLHIMNFLSEKKFDDNQGLIDRNPYNFKLFEKIIFRTTISK